MADFEILIKTEADLRAAHATNDAIDKIGKSSVVSGKAVAGLVAAIGAEGVRRAINEFAEYEEAVVGLDAALARSGQLNNEYRLRLQELSQQLEDTTNVADEKWIAALQRLTQFGSTPQTIGMDIEAVKNLAGVVGDVTTAVNLYSRALQGNFEMFGRYGIKVDEAGTKTERLHQLQEKLAQLGGGQLEARTQSLSGNFGRLSTQIGNTLQGIGNLIDRTMILRAIITVLSDAFQGFNSLLPQTVAQVNGLKNVSGELAGAFKEAGDAEPFTKTKDAAKKANDAVERLFNSMERLKSQSLAEVDQQLKEELARLDLEQASQADTPEAQREFAFRRKQATTQAEHRRANREFFQTGDEIRALRSQLPTLSGKDREDAEARIQQLEFNRDQARSDIRTSHLGVQANRVGFGRDSREAANKEVLDSAKEQAEISRRIAGELGAARELTVSALQNILRESKTWREEVERLKNRDGNRR